MQVKHSSVWLAHRTQNSVSINTHICRDHKLDFSLEKTLRLLLFITFGQRNRKEIAHFILSNLARPGYTENEFHYIHGPLPFKDH